MRWTSSGSVVARRTASITTGPNQGKILYSPDANYFGGDSFTYRVTDGAAESNTATVTLTVNAVNDAPVANDDTATTNEDTAVTINVLDNDTDVEGSPLSVDTPEARGPRQCGQSSATRVPLARKRDNATTAQRFTRAS